MSVQDTGDGFRLLPSGAAALLRQRLAELLGLALMGGAGVITAACLTYRAQDASLNSVGDGQIHNLLGAGGAVIADLALQSLGAASFFFALLLLSWGWRLLRDAHLTRWSLRVILMPLALLSLAGGLSAVPAPDSWPVLSGLGGFTGDLLRTHLVNLTGLGGALAGLITGLIGLTLFIFLLALRRSELVHASQAAGHMLDGAGRGLQDGVGKGLVRSRAGLSFLKSWRKRREEPEDPLRSAMRRAERREPLLDTTPYGEEIDVRRAQREAERETLSDEAAGSAARVAVIEGEPADPAGYTQPQPQPKPSPKRKSKPAQASLDLPRNAGGAYELPPLSLLAKAPQDDQRDGLSKDALEKNARLLEGVLGDFGVKGEIVKVRPGPVVTRYELEPAPGTKTSRVVNLADDIARSMSALSVRVAVVPGSSTIGIELPNTKRETVFLRELLEAEEEDHSGGALPVALGKDIGGLPTSVNLAKMPHLLIAGTTGSGKSVAVNAMILSLLYRLSPDQCKFIMIDPKMLELSVYDGIPHLISPVVTEPKKAVVALKWTVREMEQRYRLMSQMSVRNIDGYNKRIEEARKSGEVLTRKVQTGFDADTGQPVFEEQPFDLTSLPYIVVIVDEMADLMLVAGKDVEAAIQRLAQMARAAGIHLIMATQRPSVDVITGTIKANFPTRISFHVTSKIDSRTILGETGAEQLLGQGDMLHLAGGGRISRVHGPLVTDREVEQVVAFLKSQGAPDYVEDITREEEDNSLPGMDDESGGDDLFEQAVAIVCQHKKASTSFIQRQLQIGYNRAARIIEQMEARGIVSEANHVGKREVLITNPGGDDF